MRSNSLAAKRHFPLLDGLRGFAAISVVNVHLGSWLNTPTLATNSYLSVDLFFCLSGYVLSFAYSSQMASMRSSDFILARLVRLMPLSLLAIAISASYIVLRGIHEQMAVSYPELLNTVILSAFNLPNFNAPHEFGGPQIFPLNAPQYTILFELAVNILWWANRHRNQEKLALCLAALCLCCLPFVGLGGDAPATFLHGFPRVGASFFVGVAIFHMQDRLPDWKGWTMMFWTLAAVMVFVFYTPFPLPRPVLLAWVAILSPALVIAGARAECSKGLAAICTTAGIVSYPIYCLHYPIFCWVNGFYRSLFGPQNIIVEGPVIMAAAVIFAWAAYRYYDDPIRRYLSSRLRRSPSRRTA